MCEPRPGRHTEGAHLEDAPEALVGLPRAVDLGHHRRAGVLVQAPHRRLVDVLEVRRAARVLARGALTAPI